MVNWYLSVIINIALSVFVTGAIIIHIRKYPARIVMRYFTVLSNILCAAAALAVAILRLCGSVPMPVLLLKYVGTCAVSVTLLTVLIFLGPRVGYKFLLTGPDLFLHLICPVLAIVSLIAWDGADMGFPVVFCGVLPTAAYAVLYLYKVVLAPEGKRWEDFYGFNKGGRWRLSAVLMLSGTFLISLGIMAALNENNGP